MVAYIIKAILFSALLLVIYRLFLEKEKMHRFNRFYLLLSIILPIAVPLVPIQTGIPVLSAFEPVITAGDKLARLDLAGAVAERSKDAARPDNHVPAMDDSAKHYPAMVASVKDCPAIEGYENHPVQGDHYNHDTIIDIAGEPFSGKNNNLLGNLLLFVYLAVSTGFLLRFSRNIHAFSKKVRNNRSVPYYEAKLVLTREEIIPYSFLNYIFVNEDDYKNGTIEQAVLGHELTHIRQKHTLDILFFELVRIFGWINPFLPFYRDALRLNHEFLADESAVKECCEPVTYQYLLIKKTSQGPGMELSSPLNYLFIKKRLVMLNKKETAKRAVLKQLALIPVTGLLTMLFLNITVAAGYGGGAGPESGISDNIVSESSPPQQQNRADTTQIQAPPPLFSDDFIPVPPTGAVQAGNSSWEVAGRTDASGNEFNEITGVFEGTMQSKDIDEAPLKVKIFVTNRKGGEMFTEFYEAGSEAPENMHKRFNEVVNFNTQTHLPIKVTLNSGEIIEMGQTAGGTHMWDFNFPPPETPENPRFKGSRFGNLLSVILEEDEKISVMVDLSHVTEFNNKTYRFDIDPTGLKELFAKL
ncbi:MAG: hypothetical protein EA408_00770 [Marinilabiliales bacterium]|nr:MAG: hypothetical protein EA408_00770 [Marinilabiliales bacterium]